MAPLEPTSAPVTISRSFDSMKPVAAAAQPPAAEESKAGLYRSDDAGESWTRVSDDHDLTTRGWYYTHVEADPVDVNTVYVLNVLFWRSDDGGTTFRGTKQTPHVDYHAMVIDPDDTDHLLIGNDGGLYETFDQGATWRHFPNMPISQFYKVSVSSREPFYDILGGAQDLGTLLGPARTATTGSARSLEPVDVSHAGTAAGRHRPVHPLEHWCRRSRRRRGSHRRGGTGCGPGRTE